MRARVTRYPLEIHRFSTGIRMTFSIGARLDTALFRAAEQRAMCFGSFQLLDLGRRIGFFLKPFTSANNSPDANGAALFIANVPQIFFQNIPLPLFSSLRFVSPPGLIILFSTRSTRWRPLGPILSARRLCNRFVSRICLRNRSLPGETIDFH